MKRFIALILTLIVMLLTFIPATERSKKQKKNGGHEIASVMIWGAMPKSVHVKQKMVCVPGYIAKVLPTNAHKEWYGFELGVQTWK